MKVLPDGRNMAAEERAYLDVCHRTKSNRPDVEAILEAESFFDASVRPTHDAWGEVYDSIWIGTHREITGSSIMSALRDHLAAIQDTRCCYCFQPLLKGGYLQPKQLRVLRLRRDAWRSHPADARTGARGEAGGSQGRRRAPDYSAWRLRARVTSSARHLPKPSGTVVDSRSRQRAPGAR